ncbi:hypothetical protein BY996DRAFT_6466093 [Phakopsora pachyrhizi]|nr:hypothetical protein BY996DRAFT_6466093 [Phakopsora pachyrhizi]
MPIAAVIKLVDLAMNLWKRYLKNFFMTLSSSSVTTNTIVQRALELTITWLGACLNKQKKLDFKPKSDLAIYQDTISRIEISDLNNRVEMLRELEPAGVVVVDLQDEDLSEVEQTAQDTNKPEESDNWSRTTLKRRNDKRRSNRDHKAGETEASERSEDSGA